MKRTGRHLAAVLGAAVLLGLWGAVGAAANHGFREEISVGPNGGSAAINAFYDGNSQDGTHAVFETSESLVASDTDAAYDVYERIGNTTSLVSIGPSGGNGPSDVFFDGVSDDGSRIFFDTDEQLVPGDTDNFIDVYMRSGGVTTLISTGPAGGNGPFDVTFDGISRDGNHVWFETDEALVTGDTDGATDIYDRSGSTTALVTSGTSAGFPIFDGGSEDGTHVYFDTDESLVAADTDGQFDVYERFSGSTNLVSTGPAGGNGAFPARYSGSSATGSRVWFETDESLIAGDTDARNDVYERAAGTTTQISIGGNGAFDAFFDGASKDGSHVFFHTAEPLAGGDADTARDVYDRTGGSTVRVSTGPAGGNGPIDAFFVGTSLDGSRVFLETDEALVVGDTDVQQDVYERVGATTTNRISTGATGGNGGLPAFFDGSSADGTRVFFDTGESLEASDTDASTDAYERWNGATTHITVGPSGGNAAIGAFYDGISSDGTRVFFNTRESLISSDTDAARDVYAATVGAYPRPKGATPMHIPLVPAFNQCTSANRSHGAPLSSGSCAPPVQASAQLTVGTPDANGAAPSSVGFVRYTVLTGDVQVVASISDVRIKSTLADYTGQLQLDSSVRITDRLNGSSGDEPATGSSNFPVTIPCTGTGDTTVGSTCSVSTTINAVSPGTIVAGVRSIWELGDLKVFDGGPDGLASTAPNTLFERQGVFVP